MIDIDLCGKQNVLPIDIYKIYAFCAHRRLGEDTAVRLVAANDAEAAKDYVKKNLEARGWEVKKMAWHVFPAEDIRNSDSKDGEAIK